MWNWFWPFSKLEWTGNSLLLMGVFLSAVAAPVNEIKNTQSFPSPPAANSLFFYLQFHSEAAATLSISLMSSFLLPTRFLWKSFMNSRFPQIVFNFATMSSAHLTVAQLACHNLHFPMSNLIYVKTNAQAYFHNNLIHTLMWLAVIGATSLFTCVIHWLIILLTI